LFKKLILTLVAVSFIWGLQAPSSFAFQKDLKKIEISDESESSKKTDVEFEDLEFCHHIPQKIQSLAFVRKITNLYDKIPHKEFSPTVPTSPPNA